MSKNTNITIERAVAVEPIQTASLSGPQAGKSWLAWFLLVAVVGVAGYLPWLGSFGPIDPTDSFFLESGREMVETGKYLLPLNNYVPWLDKPVLFFWMVAGAYKLFGVSPFVGRLPVALSAVALGLVLFHSTSGQIRARAAALAAVILLCLPLSSIVGHVCLTDMTLTLCVSGTILYLHKGLRENSRGLIFLGYVFNAFGLLCKGPIASIVPAVALLSYLVLSRRTVSGVWSGIRQLNPLVGLIPAVLVNLPWYAAAMVATDGRFFEAFFWQQNFGRMMGTVNHQMPWYFYIPVFFGGFFPWCLLTICSPGFFRRAFAADRSERSKSLLSFGPVGSSSMTKTSKAAPHTDMFRLCLSWFLVVMLLFSAIKTKLPTYILPAAPAFAILVSMQLQVLMRGPGKLLLVTEVICLVALLVAVCVQPVLPAYLKTFIFTNWLAALLVFGAVGTSIVLQCRKRSRSAVVCLCAALTMACAVFVPKGLRAFHDHRQVGFNSLVTIAGDAKASVAILSAEEPMMPYILHKPVFRLQSGEAAAEFVSTGDAPHYLLVPKEMVARLDWFPGGNRFVAAKGKWYLYEVFAP
ncbi:MAG: glycosyltransferase family 39 protein [Candidatus Obscuribacterales bacterium]|nr:glycosyltransferase family 39 protein [Candidatus Obscuribacterales bacterium]